MSLIKEINETKREILKEKRSKNAENELKSIVKKGNLYGWKLYKPIISVSGIAKFTTNYGKKDRLCLNVELNDDIRYYPSKVELKNCKKSIFGKTYLEKEFKNNEEALDYAKKIAKNRDSAIKLAMLKEKVI
jgi:hypothetical protein